MVMNSTQNTTKDTFGDNRYARVFCGRLEITRDRDFLNGTRDIFDVLATQKQERDALEKNLDETIALLKRSTTMLQDAENTIEKQNQKLAALEATALHDEASGLLNRRGFFDVFRREIARMRRQRSEGGLLVIFNLENLKMIRQKHGKEAADMAVALVGKAFQDDIRETDYAARIMDEEFVLLFTDTSLNQSLARLQNLALQLNKLSLIWGMDEINLNLSLGLKNFSSLEEANKIFDDAAGDLNRNRKGNIVQQKIA